MKKTLTLLGLFLVVGMNAQDLKVPTLASKGIKGKATKMELSRFDFVKDKGLTLTQSDVEHYDEKGRLTSIERTVHSSGAKYLYTYQLNKKGLLEQVKITNATNNQTIRTTDYEYKKNQLVKTTQVQGTVTFVRDYSYDKNGHLIKVVATENGTLKGEETYEVDSEGRRTKKSQKLPTDTEAKTLSTFTYKTENGKEVKTENRDVNGVKYEIVVTKDLNTDRNLKETTKNLSNSQSGHNDFLYEEDAKGSWIKGEIIDNQFSRSRLILRKITYSDGEVGGRTKMVSPDDDRAQYIRQYSQSQVAVNGMTYNSSTPTDLDYTTDRLTFVSGLNLWVLLKDYDGQTSRKTWTEGQVIAAGRDKVLWSPSSNGIKVFAKGKRLFESPNSVEAYSDYEIGGSTVAYIRANINQSFVAEHSADQAGKVLKAKLSDQDYYWGKASDSTYVLTAFGKSIKLEKQLEDKEGNKLAMRSIGAVYYWYGLPNFRNYFDEGKVGDIHEASYLTKPLDAIGKEFNFSVDFSGFSYVKLKDRRYSLRSKNGTKVTSIASKSVRTPDDQLMAYFPLTEQYLKMDNYYKLEEGKEHTGQSVTPMLVNHTHAYYIYNEGKSINFYKPGERFSGYAFNSHKLNGEKTVYGALLYDSLSNLSYGMTYDTQDDKKMGPMYPLPGNSKGAYLLKLENNRWVIFQKGQKIGDYTFSALRDNGDVIHFYKEKGKTGALEFSGFKDAEVGSFIYANNLLDTQVKEFLTELGFDPDLRKSESDVGSGKKASSYDKKSDLFYVRDASGTYIQGNLAWYGNYGFDDHLIAYDSVYGLTYQLDHYYGVKDITEANLEVLINNKEVKALKTGRSALFISVNGAYQTDISRVFITQNQEDAIWKEVIYDASEKKSYLISYPSDSSSHVLVPELAPPAADDTFIFRINDKNFIGVAKGSVVKDKTIRYRVLDDDLIRMDTEGGTTTGYRFPGYTKTPLLKLIGAERIPSSEVSAIWAKAGEALKKKTGN